MRRRQQRQPRKPKLWPPNECARYRSSLRKLHLSIGVAPCCITCGASLGTRLRLTPAAALRIALRHMPRMPTASIRRRRRPPNPLASPEIRLTEGARAAPQERRTLPRNMMTKTRPWPSRRPAFRPWRTRNAHPYSISIPRPLRGQLKP